MEKGKQKNQESDIEKIKIFLINLGFVLNSYPSADNLIYSKDGETVVIKNRQKLKKDF
jgi:hypothetical protein